MLAAQPALDDAGSRQLVEAPREVDERHEQEERTDGTPRRCCWRRAAAHVLGIRQPAPLGRRVSGAIR
jgi:hypothetical protein